MEPFFFIAFYDKSTNFSLYLSVISLCVTLSFEMNEWILYCTNRNTKEIKPKNILKDFPPLLLNYILLIFIFCTFKGLIVFIKFLEGNGQKIPNIIAALTLLIYFISYTIRIIHQKYKEFKKDFTQLPPSEDDGLL